MHASEVEKLCCWSPALTPTHCSSRCSRRRRPSPRPQAEVAQREARTARMTAEAEVCAPRCCRPASVPLEPQAPGVGGAVVQPVVSPDPRPAASSTRPQRELEEVHFASEARHAGATGRLDRWATWRGWWDREWIQGSAPACTNASSEFSLSSPVPCRLCQGGPAAAHSRGSGADAPPARGGGGAGRRGGAHCACRHAGGAGRAWAGPGSGAVGCRAGQVGRRTDASQWRPGLPSSAWASCPALPSVRRCCWPRRPRRRPPPSLLGLSLPWSRRRASAACRWLPEGHEGGARHPGRSWGGQPGAAAGMAGGGGAQAPRQRSAQLGHCSWVVLWQRGIYMALDSTCVIAPCDGQCREQGMFSAG